MNNQSSRKPFSNKYAVGSGGGGAELQFANAITLPPGSQATVTNLGTPAAPVLQLGLPQGQPGDVLTGNATVENLTVNGLVLSGKQDIVTGFTGGPRLSQGGWDLPSNTHLLPWSELADGCDNVTGLLYVHASSKDASRKNGVATITVVKDLGHALDAMVTTLHASPALQTFDIHVINGNIHVMTDSQCSVCWSFIAAT